MRQARTILIMAFASLVVFGVSTPSFAANKDVRHVTQRHRVKARADKTKRGPVPSEEIINEPNPFGAAVGTAVNGFMVNAQNALAPIANPVTRDPKDRKGFYIAQRNSYSCGPAVLAMAISDHATHKQPTYTDVDKLTKESGTRSSDGFPDWPNVMPQVVKNHGLQAQAYTFAVGDRSAIDVLDRELALGHSGIVHVNNPRTKSGNGHFVYVAGRTAAGTYVIGNPDAPANASLAHDKPISRQSVENMMVMTPRSHPKFYKGIPGFTSVW